MRFAVVHPVVSTTAINSASVVYLENYYVNKLKHASDFKKKWRERQTDVYGILNNDLVGLRSSKIL
jgi:hypothetical protein